MAGLFALAQMTKDVQHECAKCNKVGHPMTKCPGCGEYFVNMPRVEGKRKPEQSPEEIVKGLGVDIRKSTITATSAGSAKPVPEKASADVNKEKKRGGLAVKELGKETPEDIAERMLARDSFATDEERATDLGALLASIPNTDEAVKKYMRKQ